jgi:hypothetical protein
MLDSKDIASDIDEIITVQTRLGRVLAIKKKNEEVFKPVLGNSGIH